MQELPLPYRCIVVAFGMIDAIAIAVIAIGWRPWIHAVGTILISTVFVLLLWAFFVPAPPQRPVPRRERFAGWARLLAGGLLLFVSGWFLVGFLEGLERGNLPDNVLEGLVFITGVIAMGALLMRRGVAARRRVSRRSEV